MKVACLSLKGHCPLCFVPRSLCFLLLFEARTQMPMLVSLAAGVLGMHGGLKHESRMQSMRFSVGKCSTYNMTMSCVVTHFASACV